METSRRRQATVIARAAIVMLSALVLSGCASPAPATPEASVSPTQAHTTPAAPHKVDREGTAASVSTITMSGSQLMSETAIEQPRSSVDFAEGTDAAVVFLSDALATAPELSTSEIEACSNVTARYSWGGTALVLDVWEPAGFVVTFNEPSFNGVALKSSGNFAVGDNAQAFFDALPREQAVDEYNDGSGPFVYDKVADASPWGESNAYGGVARLVTGGEVVSIVAPDTTRAFYC